MSRRKSRERRGPYTATSIHKNISKKDSAATARSRSSSPSSLSGAKVIKRNGYNATVVKRSGNLGNDNSNVQSIVKSGPEVVTPSGIVNYFLNSYDENDTNDRNTFLHTQLAFRFAPTLDFTLQHTSENEIHDRLWIQVLYQGDNRTKMYTIDDTDAYVAIVAAIEMPSEAVHMAASPGGNRVAVVLADGSVLCYDIIALYDSNSESEEEEDGVDNNQEAKEKVVVSCVPRWSIPFMVTATKLYNESISAGPIRTFEFSSCSDHILLVDAESGKLYLLDADTQSNDIDARTQEHRHTEIYMFPKVSPSYVIIDQLHPYHRCGKWRGVKQKITSACWSPSTVTSRSKKEDLHIAVGYSSCCEKGNSSNQEHEKEARLSGTIRIFHIHMWEEKPRLNLIATLSPPKIEKEKSENDSDSHRTHEKVNNNNDTSKEKLKGKLPREVVIEPWQCTQVAWLQPKRGKSTLFIGYGTSIRKTIKDNDSENANLSGGDGDNYNDDGRPSKVVDLKDSDDRFRTAFFSGELPYQFADYIDDNDDDDQQQQSTERIINVDWSDDVSSPHFSMKGNTTLPEVDEQYYYSVEIPCSKNLDICRSIDTNRRLEDDAAALNEKYSSSSPLSSAFTSKKNKEEKKHVHFGSIEIRVYETVLGDNPCARFGPPLSIGWSYSMEIIKTSLPVDCHDKCYLDKGVQFLNNNARRARLAEFGFSNEEMDIATENASRIQLHRAESMKEDQDRMYFRNLGRRLFRVIRKASLNRPAHRSYNDGSSVGRAL